MYFSLSTSLILPRVKGVNVWGDGAFIKNVKEQHTDRPFEKGQGIDFYIDQARYLTDNVTITKVPLSLFALILRLRFT